MASESKTACIPCKGPDNSFDEPVNASVSVLNHSNVGNWVNVAVGCPFTEARDVRIKISTIDKLLGDKGTEKKVFCRRADKLCIHKYPR